MTTGNKITIKTTGMINKPSGNSIFTESLLRASLVGLIPSADVASAFEEFYFCGLYLRGAVDWLEFASDVLAPAQINSSEWPQRPPRGDLSSARLCGRERPAGIYNFDGQGDQDLAGNTVLDKFVLPPASDLESSR